MPAARHSAPDGHGWSSVWGELSFGSKVMPVKTLTAPRDISMLCAFHDSAIIYRNVTFPLFHTLQLYVYGLHI